MAGIVCEELKFALEEGKTALSAQELISRLRKRKVKNPERLLISAAADSEIFVSSDFKVFALREIYEAEKEVVRNLVLIDSRGLRPSFPRQQIQSFLDQKCRVRLSESQREFIIKVLSTKRQVFLLSGAAGTGKTTCLKWLVEALKEFFCPLDQIVGVSFTGRAAAVIHEKTSIEAKTLHSLLRYRKEGSRFVADEMFRLQSLRKRVIIVDESSQIDLFLFRELVSHIPKDALLIFVGDPNQLDPVGPGRVFSDLLELNLFESTKLTRVFRQDSSSLKDFAWSVLRGEFQPEPSENLRVFDSADPREILSLSLSEAEQSSSMKSILFLTYSNRIGIGVELLNRKLGPILNPKGPTLRKSSGLVLRGFDRVINLANRVVFSVRSEPFKVMNGQIGYVVDWKDSELTVDFELDQAKVSLYDFPRLIRPAYAITVHKSQGSEFDHVVLVADPRFVKYMDRHWLYTAVTRARERLTVIGPISELEKAARRKSVEKRTSLLSLLRKEEILPRTKSQPFSF